MEGRITRSALVATLVVTLAAANQAAADEATPEESSLSVEPVAVNVGLSGDLSCLRITGCVAFSTDEVLAALRRDVAYQVSVRPTSPLLGAIDALRQRTIDGYRHAGYLNVQATSGYDRETGGLWLNVVEGEKYVAGEIQVVAGDGFDSAELVRRLQAPVAPRPWTYKQNDKELYKIGENGEEAAWESGGALDVDQTHEHKLTENVKRCLADMGRPFAKFTTRVEPGDDGAADLVIDISNPGPAATWGNLKIEGLSRHTEEQVLAYLQLAGGSLANAAEVERVCESIRGSCRFWKYTVEVAIPETSDDRYGSDVRRPELRLVVTEYDLVPPLGEPLSEVDQCLVRAAAWFEAFERRDAKDEIAWEGSEGGTRAKGVISPERGAVVRFHHETEGSPYRAYVAIVDGPGDLEIIDWLTGQRLQFSGVAHPKPSLTFKPGEIEDGEYKNVITFHFGMGSNPKSPGRTGMWKVNAEPVCWVNSAHRKSSQAEIANGVLAITSDTARIRVDVKTGAVIEASESKDGFAGTIRTGQGEFERLRAEIARDAEPLASVYDPTAPWQSAARFVIDSIAAQPFASNDGRVKLLCTELRKFVDLSDTELKLRELLASVGIGDVKDGHKAFFIPPATEGFSLGGNSVVTGLALSVASRVADALFPQASWPWTALREITFVSAKTPEGIDWKSGAAMEFQRAFTGPDIGPLSMIAISRFSGALFGSRNQAMIARAGLARLDECNIQNDVALLAVGDHGLARIVRTAILMSDDLDSDERKNLVAAIPETWRPVVEGLLARRATHPDEAPEASLEAELTAKWDGPLCDAVRAELEQLATVEQTPAQTAQAPTDTATK